MLLFFDTETTGLPKNYSAPVSDSANWPRLVQLGYIIIDPTIKGDTKAQVVKRRCLKISPDGFSIPLPAVQIHGITTEDALETGIDIDYVLDEFLRDTARKQVTHIVAFNLHFDKHIIGAELHRLSQTGKNRVQQKLKLEYFMTKPGICAMEAAKKHLGYRPNLAGLYKTLYKKEFTTAHDAMRDIRVTAGCFFKMVEIKAIPDPATLCTK